MATSFSGEMCSLMHENFLINICSVKKPGFVCFPANHRVCDIGVNTNSKRKVLKNTFLELFLFLALQQAMN
jgi:hypothetical protein